MKLISINPKHLLRSKKQRSLVSRSDPPSFGSVSEDSSTHKPDAGNYTPTSVLHHHWSDVILDFRWDLAQAFRLIDRDNDGLVSRQDLETVLTRLGASDVSLMLREVHGDACITVESLANHIGSSIEPGSDPDELKEAFAVFDTDRDGRISAEELLRVFTAIGDERCTLEECRRMIEGVSRNGDGFVCFEDFSHMMELQHHQ